MNPLIESHREAIRSIAARDGIERVSVFGSMARDDADEASDIGLLITLPEGTSGLVLGSLLTDVPDLMQRRVDVLTEAIGSVVEQDPPGLAQAVSRMQTRLYKGKTP